MLKIPVKIIPDRIEPEHRTIVYIDGQNFLHRCAKSLARSGALNQTEKLTNLDLKYIFKKLFPYDNLELKYYSVSKTNYRTEKDEHFNEKSKIITDNLRQIKVNFNNQGIKIRNVGQLKARNTEPCKKCGFSNLRFQEKGVDVGLAVEMVRDAMLGLANRVVLASSDVDLLPAIRIINILGIETIYVGFKSNMTKGLISATKSSREISNLTVLESYISAINFKK